MRAAFISVVGVAVALALGYYLSRVTKEPVTAPTTRAFDLPKRINRLYREPRPVAPIPKTVSTACSALWTSLGALDLETDFKPPRASDCLGLPSPLDRFHALYAQSCQKKSDDCLSALFQYRAQITHFTTQNLDIAATRDMRILVDKLMATFDKDPKLAIALADRIKELEPDNSAAHTAGLIATILSEPSAKGDRANPLWDNIERRFEALKKTDPENAISHEELALFLTVIRENDAETVYEQGADLFESNPDSAIGPYFMAWAENRRGNRDAALGLIKQALTRDSKNPRYQKTYEALQQGRENAFTFSMSFPLAPR